MALNIKDPEADRLARALAAATGESITVAARAAFAERLARVQARDTAPEVLADLADAVALGLLPGESTPLQVDTEPLAESPAHALDADEAGVTLLRVRDGESTAVHMALPGAGRLDHSPRHAWRRRSGAASYRPRRRGSRAAAPRARPARR